ncbi:MAG: Ankyrin-2 [Icmadophila ericetorum]|nr:Ankyrin-2 [Icmadophila ericetorum]
MLIFSSLATAIGDFQAALTPEQKQQFFASSSKPDEMSIIMFLVQLDQSTGRKRRGVSSRISKVLESVQQFSTVVDTFVQAQPLAALVWSTLKFAILAVSNIASFFDKLSEYFLEWSRHCPRYSEYSFLFGDSTGLQIALCAYYAVIVNFCTRALRTLQKPGTTLAYALWRPFEKEFGEFTKELRRRNEEVTEEIRLASEQKAAKERQLGIMFRSEARERRLRKEQERARAARADLLWKLSQHDYLGPLRRIRKKRYSETSSWLSKTHEFQGWLMESKSSILWLSGIVGSGKSVVIAAAIESLLSLPLRNGNERIGFFFCEYDNRESLRPETVLRALIRQCLLAETLSKAMIDKLKDVFQHSPPDTDDLEALLHYIAATSDQIIFVIDGLDECDQRDRRILLKMIRRLISSSPSIIRILISARGELIEDIDREFQTYQQVNMDNEAVYNDISIFVRDTLEEKRAQGDLRVGGTQLLQEISDALVKGAHGMFLWVTFQIEDLCRQKCDADIRDSLRRLPRTITETYQRLLLRIVDEGDTAIVNTALRWVAAAKRPLLLDELLEAIAIKAGDRSLRRDRVLNLADPDCNRYVPWCVPLCRSLLVTDEEDLSVRFAHHTIKQFLISEHSTPPIDRFHFQMSEVDFMAGEMCVTYLNLSDFERRISRVRNTISTIYPVDIASSAMTATANSTAKYGIKFAKLITKKSSPNFDVLDRLDQSSDRNLQYAFLKYASQYWLSHTTGFRPENTPTWTSWKNMVLTENPLAAKPWTVDDQMTITGPIFDFIVKEDHKALVSCLKEVHVKVGTEPIGKLLHQACSSNDFGTAELILTLGNGLSWEDLNLALQTALRRNYGNIVSLFLAREVDATAALRIAAEAGHTQVVQQLLDFNLVGCINTLGGSGLTQALCAAVDSGQIRVISQLLGVGVQYVFDIESELLKISNHLTEQRLTYLNGLLENQKNLIKEAKDRADSRMIVEDRPQTNTRSHPYGQILFREAARKGYLGIVGLLLIVAVETDLLVYTELSQRASKYDSLALIDLLKKSGMRVGIRNQAETSFNNAIATAHIKIARDLLAAKSTSRTALFGKAIELQVDVNYSSQNKETPLHMAARFNYKNVAELLIGAHANVNVANATDATPLHVAAYHGFVGIVEMLLNAGANPNARNLKNETALHEAAKRDHTGVVNLLLNAKTDIEVKDRKGHTVLHYAAEGGNLSVVTWLLSADADIDSRGGHQQTPLHEAADGGHYCVVAKLLEEGAEVRFQDKDGYTALHSAAAGGHTAIVEILRREKDLDFINVQDKQGFTALNHAAKRGHALVVESLLDGRADINVKNKEGYTALHNVAIKGNAAMVKRLLNGGADIHMKDRDGFTALHSAAEAGHADVVQAIREFEADKRFISPSLQSKNNEGRTALQIARDKGHTEVVELLSRESHKVRSNLIPHFVSIEERLETP